MRRPQQQRHRSPSPGDAAARLRIAIVYPHRLLASALAACLSRSPDIEVTGVHDTLQMSAVLATRPDVLLLSYISMLASDLEMIESLRAELPNLKLLVLTSTVDEEIVEWCIAFGAVGCVAKEQSLEDLVRALHLAADGKVLFDAETLMGLLGKRGYPEARLKPSAYLLGPREIAVLEALADGLGTAAVAERLTISPHTVRAHLKSALSKLRAHSRPEAIALALRHGLIRPPG